MRHETGDASGDARLKDLASRDSRPLAFTLKAWPVIAAVTIGICFLTQWGAKLFGIELPEQTNIELVKRCFAQAFVSAKHFGVAAFLVAQVLVLLPVVEECVFRWGLFSLVFRLVSRVLRRGEGVRRETRDASGGEDARRETRDAGGGRKTVDGRLCSIAVFSSALFSAAHYIAQPWPDNAFIALFFFGLAQCGLYRRTGRLWCAMLNHLLFNLTNLLLLFVA